MNDSERQHGRCKCKHKGHNPKRPKYAWLKWLFPITGLAALIWFLVRVIPKPTRATYPCQRVAAPLASSFVIWLMGILGSVTFLRKARGHLHRSRRWVAGMLIAAGVGCLWLAMSSSSPEPVIAGDATPNDPIGTARGIHPGRVVWVHDPNATDWEGYRSDEYWWEPNQTDINVVENMMKLAIRGIAGEPNDRDSWDAIFRYFNVNRGKGDIGYQPGERMMIKVNLTTCNARTPLVDPLTYDKKDHVLNNIDNAPQMLLCLLRHLVNTVGVDPNNITLGDPTGMIPNYYWNMLTPEFPDVNYLDNYGGSGRTRAEFSDTPLNWSTPDADGKLQDYLPVSFDQADYIINFAVLKGHSCGITLCAKNHYGSLLRCPDTYLRDAGYLDYYDMHQSLPNARWSPGMGHYRALVDLMGDPKLGGKTLLYLVDGLYGGYTWNARPYKWSMPPFGDGNDAEDWPSSLFASLDPVAIDSVGYDFLLAEWPHIVAEDGLEGGAEDYLHEAAEANAPDSGTFYDPDKDANAMESLGVHEHWNNSTDKQYSRNLGTADGIELIKLPSPFAGDLTYDGRIDGQDLMRFAQKWLWSGTPGGVTQDLCPDGTVNFNDFAIIAKGFNP